MMTATENTKDDADHRGIECPRCGCGHFHVLYTRKVFGGAIRRRRECRHCGHRVTTHESCGSGGRKNNTKF